MPFNVIESKGCYKVVNVASGKVHAECTSKAKAEAQMKLLRGLEHGMIPRKKK